MQKVFLETYGCQMNEYDTELIKAILEKKKYTFVNSELEADVVMLNTCAIRENAHRKVYGRIHDVRHKRNGSPVKIGILGCMATNLRQELLENKNLDIDFIAGPDSYKRLPQLISESMKDGNSKAFDVTLSEFETYSDIKPAQTDGVNAWIAVMRGCNNFCSFCVVPYTRGRERSRSIANVVEEAQFLASQGFKQITLLGQNVNSYKHEDNDFADLMQEVAQVDGIERIRFTSPHPKDFPHKFLKVMANNKNICKQIHLPLQAGSNRVLDLMNRTYTQEEFYALVDNIRQTIPGVALSTDIIIGFSSETDDEFQETFDVMKKVEFDSAFIFKYSQRKHTIASKSHPDDVPEAVKTERIVKLNELQKGISLKKNKEHEGSTQNVLIEKEETNKSLDFFLGRTDNNKLVTFPKCTSKQGDIIQIKIIEATPFALKGEAIK